VTARTDADLLRSIENLRSACATLSRAKKIELRLRQALTDFCPNYSRGPDRQPKEQNLYEAWNACSGLVLEAAKLRKSTIEAVGNLGDDE
jgi:hypothetical protein